MLLFRPFISDPQKMDNTSTWRVATAELETWKGIQPVRVCVPSNGNTGNVVALT